MIAFKKCHRIKIYALLTCILFSGNQTNADQPDAKTPKVTTEWTFAPDLSSVSLSITNVGTQRIFISPHLEFVVVNSNDKIPHDNQILEGYGSNIYPTIIFIARPDKSGKSLPQLVRSGQEATGTEISPGETRVIKYDTPDLVAIAKTCVGGIFSLKWNNKKIVEDQLFKDDDKWHKR